MEPGPPDDMSVSLGEVVVNGNRDIRRSRRDGGVRRLWVFSRSG